MGSVTFAIDDKLKQGTMKFPWVNWSELAREEFMRRQELHEKSEEFERIVSKSRFTEKDALSLGRKVNESLHKKYKKLYPGLR
jgi:hypothetical protein